MRRSASKRAITSRESMPALISFSATVRRTGSACSARQTSPMPPSPTFSSRRYGPTWRPAPEVGAGSVGSWVPAQRLPDDRDPADLLGAGGADADEVRAGRGDHPGGVPPVPLRHLGSGRDLPAHEAPDETA